MAIVAIDGTGGVGKSFLSAQLAALTRCPVIPEGEVGVFPEWVTNSFASHTLVSKRNTWFTERCVRAGECAMRLGTPGIHCFIDSGPLTHEAYLRVDAARHDSPEVHLQADRLRSVTPDLCVVLLTDEAELRSVIARRAREFEQHEMVVSRMISVQEEIQSLARHYPVLTIDRRGKDYSRYADLDEVWHTIAEVVAALPLESQG